MSFWSGGSGSAMVELEWVVVFLLKQEPILERERNEKGRRRRERNLNGGEEDNGDGVKVQETLSV